jgi:hypothetical protein
MKMHEVIIKLTKSQILKILNDEAFDVKHEHIGHGKHILHLSTKNLRKLQNGENKLKLSNDEKYHTIEGNGGIGKFFKNVGRKLKHTFTPSNIESALIHEGIPMATSTLGTALGGPFGGFAGAVAGHEIADLVGEKAGKGMKIANKKKSIGMRKKRTEGKGLFKALHKIGISRKDVKHAGKVIGKAAVEHGIDAIGTAAAAYGFPVPPAITESLKKGADHLIDGNHQKAYETIKAPAKEIMKEAVQKQVDKLPIQVQPYVNEQVISMGFGLKKKHGRVVKGGTARITRQAKKLYKNEMHGFGLSDETFSPYLSIHNPAFHPYQPTVNSFTKVVPLNRGNGLFGPSGGGLF